ncbi:MAG: response regulator [Chloroflexi bacterium]|nr:MAG: response regulator [Chloroflexota bacterium]
MIDLKNTPILFIVANPSTRQSLDDMLSGTNITFEFAETSERGLKRATQLLPIAIVLDIDIPALDSYETCRRLRANPLLRSVPVVMLCDHSERDDRAAGLSAGADDFLDKPLDGLELLSRLHTITRLNTYRLLLNDLTRFSWMVEHAQEGYLMLDKAGGIQYANESAVSFLNLPEDFQNLPFNKVVERLYVPEPAEVWESWLEDPSPCYLIQPESPTARAVWVVLEALDTPLDLESHRIVRLRDVTERMSLYQDMRRFHTVISHKLRTPMSMFYTSISILKNRMANLSPEDVKKMMETAITGTDRLAEEVRRILTYVDAPLALNLGKPVNLGALPEMVQSISETLRLRNVLLSLPVDLRPTVIALTPDALEIILHELLDNARKFHPSQNPQVEISIGQMDEDHIRIRVADDGMTLSVEQLAWAWLPYFQSEKDFTGEIPGMGLGFPMVVTLVWKAGGTLHLMNRPDGPGVIVDINIPLESTMRKMERSAAPFGG